jgi:diaminopimelate epimerase
MEVWNADGSQAEMCGNGLRCVAKYLAERDPGLADSEALAIETGAGVLACRLWRTGAEVAEVEVAMGTPRFRRGEIPMDGPLEGSFLLQPIVVQGRPFAASAVSLGNPHLVLFVAGDEPLRELARHYGPAIETHPLFPRRTNVEFARQRAAAEIDLVVWERGCGITLACGTGACATVAAGCQAGLLQEEVPYAVHLPGGTLTIRLSQGQAFMRGPACEVFTGQIDVGRGLAPRPVQAM